MNMRPNTHNGFILRYEGYTFPPSNSNRITKECFHFMGGLSNDRLYKITHEKPHKRETYYRLDKL